MEEVKNAVKEHFAVFFKESNTCRPMPEGILFKFISERDKRWLERSLGEEEVRDAMWSCDSNKSAGSDGFTIEFYNQNWDLLKKDVLSFLSDFHNSATLTKVCATSFLTLIPRIQNPQSLYMSSRKYEKDIV